MAKEQQISLSTLQMLVKLVTPAVIAPVAPIVPVSPGLQNYSNDHDLLTQVNGKVDNLVKSVDDLTRGMAQHVTTVDFNEYCKAQTETYGDHETRLRGQKASIDTLNTSIQVIKGQFRAWLIAMGVIWAVIQGLGFVLLHFIK